MKHPWKIQRLSHWLTLLACLLAVFTVAGFGDQLTFIQRIDNAWLDTLAKWRTKTHRPDPEIVIIDIDDDSLERMDKVEGNWPWKRAVHAYVIEWLEEQGAKQIAFDIWFTERDKYFPESDEYLGETLNKFDNVFIPTLQMRSDDPQAPLLSSYSQAFGIVGPEDKSQLGRAHLLTPIFPSIRPHHIGAINYVADADGKARRYDIYRDIKGWKLYSMPALMLQAQGRVLPAQANFLIDWVGPEKNPYTTYAYADVYAKVLDGKPDPSFKDKVVFIGSTATGLHDLRPTALDPQYPGLYMLTTAYSNLKNGEELKRWSVKVLWPLAVLPILLVGLLLFKKMHTPYPMAITFGIVALAISLAYYVSMKLSQNAQLLPVNSIATLTFLIIFTGALLQYFEERRTRQHAVETFSRFLDKTVVAQLVNEGENAAVMAPRSVPLTILFSDIRGFTTISETKPPAEIMEMLNAYFTRQVEMIFKHKGTLDKFIGDAVMAFWGAPIADPDHAYNAVAAALDMSRALDEFKQDRGLEDFDIGIGINTGPAVVGMLGSAQKTEYTAIGDTINLGSRLEGLTKGKARILVAESTRIACGDRIEFREVGTFAVKGRAEEVRVFEPLRVL